MLIAGLNNFGVTNQVVQVSSKFTTGDLMLFSSYEVAVIVFCDLIICGSSFKIQEISVLLVTGFINFGVTNQAPRVSFNFVVEDSMLVFPYEIMILDIVNYWLFLKLY